MDLWDLDVIEWDFMGAKRIRIHGAGNLWNIEQGTQHLNVEILALGLNLEQDYIGIRYSNKVGWWRIS